LSPKKPRWKKEEAKIGILEMMDECGKKKVRTKKTPLQEKNNASGLRRGGVKKTV